MTEYNGSQTTYSNELLSEQMRNLQKEFREFKKETKMEIRELEQDVEVARRLAESADNSMIYVKESVGKMEAMMTSFINVVNAQNEKIDEFINSDKRRDAKKEFVVSVLQVVSGIAIALIGFWASGRIG